MDGKILARLGAVVFVAVAITATVIELTRKEEAPVGAVALPRPAIDPRRAELRRCRDMGEAAMRDPVCLRFWADNRDRFLGQGTSSSPAPAPRLEAPRSPTGTATEDPVRRESAPLDATAPLPQVEPARPEAR